MIVKFNSPKTVIFLLLLVCKELLTVLLIHLLNSRQLELLISFSLNKGDADNILFQAKFLLI